MEYTVKITDYASVQLREIFQYIKYSLQAPETALQLLDLLEKQINSLSQFPNRISLTHEEPWRSCGIHKMPVKNYLIYFWIDETVKEVHVTAVIYAKRDQAEQLSKMDM